MLRRCLVPAALLVAVGGLVPLASPASAAPVVLAQWKLDEPNAGDVAADQAGANPGTPGAVNGASLPAPSAEVAPTAFANPHSLAFGGENFVEVGNPLAQAADYSVCAWVRTTSPAGTLLDAASPGVQPDLAIGLADGGRLTVESGGLDGTGTLVDSRISGSTPVDDGLWHSLCVTRDNATGEVRLYVDATLDGQGVAGTGQPSSNPRARIGGGFDGSPGLNGLLDEVTVYGVALTQAQVANLRGGGADPDSLPDLPTPSISAPGPAAALNAWAPVVDWDGASACQYSWDGATWTDVDCAAAGADIAAPAADGAYVLHLRGRSPGVLWASSEQSFTWDTTAPAVDAGADRAVSGGLALADAAASDATAGVASYAWTKESGPGAVTFEDPAVLQPTVSAIDKDGTYVLRLTVTDLAGNTTHDDVTVVWDTTAPRFDLRATPVQLTNDASARFTFDVTEALSGPGVVQCSLDGQAFAACTSPVAYSNLSEGEHTWRVRGMDGVGNRRTHDAVRWVVDTVAPSLTRVGAEQVQVQVGTAYVDAGATALDSRQGDLSSAVVTTGQVDTATPGTYTLTYGVRDAAGNVANPLTRTVTVVAATVGTTGTTGTTDGSEDSAEESPEEEQRDVLDLLGLDDALRDGGNGSGENGEDPQGEVPSDTLESGDDVVDSELLATTTEAAPATGLRRTDLGSDLGSLIGGSLLVLGALFVMSRRRYA